MASDTLVVVSGHDRVGTLIRSAGELAFHYEPAWQRTPGASCLVDGGNVPNAAQAWTNLTNATGIAPTYSMFLHNARRSC